MAEPESKRLSGLIEYNITKTARLSGLYLFTLIAVNNIAYGFEYRNNKVQNNRRILLFHSHHYPNI